MRDCDLADSPLASCLPESPACDSLRDFLRDALSSYRGPLPTTPERFLSVVWQLIERGLAEAEAAGLSLADESASRPGTVPVGAAVAVLVPVLRLMSRDSDRHYALRAICYLRLLGYEGRSYQAIGDEFGVTRAAVQIIFRTLQRRHPEIRSRGDKSDAAREACRMRRLGTRKVHEPWTARHLWTRPLSIAPSPL